VVFLDFLRAAAILLVLWDHLVAQWLGQDHRSWLPLVQVNRFVTGPFALIQDLGWLGVSLFFLISGYIVTRVAAVETMRAFAVRRLLRIYPPLVFAVLVGVAVIALRRGLHIPDTALQAVPPPARTGDALWSVTLLNWLRWPHPVVLGVTWTLVIEMIFYLLTFLGHPLLRRGALATWANLAVIALILGTAKLHGTSYFLFAVSASYVPLLLCGQICWLAHSRRIRMPHALLLTALAWIEFVVGLERIQPAFLTAGNSYGVSFLAAAALFLLALLRADRWRGRRLARTIAERSYSLYLLHAPVALLVLDRLAGRVGYTVALVAAVLALAVATEASYRWVELTAQRLARRLTRSGRRAAARVRPVRAPEPAG